MICDVNVYALYVHESNNMYDTYIIFTLLTMYFSPAIFSLNYYPFYDVANYSNVHEHCKIDVDLLLYTTHIKSLKFIESE